MIDYFDPYQNVCPNSMMTYVRQIDAPIASAAVAFSVAAAAFLALGGATTPNFDIHTYT